MKGNLWCYLKTPEKILAHKAACPATVFFFPRLAGAGSLGLFGFSLALVRLLLSAGQNSHR